MKAIQRMKRAAAWSLSALALSAVLMGTVACTRGGSHTPADTTGTSTTVTTPANGSNGTGTGTNRPLDPDAGTVDPNGDAGDPPAGTEGSSRGRGIMPRVMH